MVCLILGEASLGKWSGYFVGNKLRHEVRRVTFWAMVYVIWKERNNVLFRGAIPSIHVIKQRWFAIRAATGGGTLCEAHSEIMQPREIIPAGEATVLNAAGSTVNSSDTVLDDERRAQQHGGVDQIVTAETCEAPTAVEVVPEAVVAAIEQPTATSAVIEERQKAPGPEIPLPSRRNGKRIAADSVASP
ncbi:hypothetical protein Droror1_Dr00011511 [Drosera rotundifolia]